MTLCAVFSALLCICAWLAVPVGDISVTMQTFGLFLCLGLLGGKYGCICILVYLLSGCAGLPVFSGFQGGFGILFSTTGGYIWGFLFSGLLYWLITGILGDHPKIRLLAMILGLITCYLLGSLWYLHIYLDTGNLSFAAVLLKCVVPYLIPDAVKLTLTYFLTNRLRKHLNI